ncbi:MAG: transporter substrate-binding domain-containing protein [Deltaproteobacteria bacterium]|nr:transporter substrate-binding domain-containing protein [Deltaproteobacteria bacterium]
MIRYCRPIICLLIFFVAVFGSQTVFAEESRPIAAITHWPPMKVIKGDSFEGIDVSILEELGNRLNLHFRFIECPWNRCLEKIRAGQADFITGLAKDIDREKYMYFIEPPYKQTFSSVFYARKVLKGRPHPIQRYEDLYKSEVGMIRGSLYFDRFDKDQKIVKVKATNELQLLKMLDLGRFDIIIGNVLNFDYLIQTHGFSGKFEKAPFKVDRITPTYIAISKKSKFIDVIPRLGVALKNMVESKKIQAIEKAYIKKFKAN